MVKSRFGRFAPRFTFAIAATIGFTMWWTRWPLQTASRLIKDRDSFLTALKESEPYTYERYSRDADLWNNTHQSELYIFQRTWPDVIYGRQKFGAGPFLFTIERSGIVSGPNFYFRSGDVWITR